MTIPFTSINRKSGRKSETKETVTQPEMSLIHNIHLKVLAGLKGFVKFLIWCLISDSFSLPQVIWGKAKRYIKRTSALLKLSQRLNWMYTKYTRDLFVRMIFVNGRVVSSSRKFVTFRKNENFYHFNASYCITIEHDNKITREIVSRWSRIAPFVVTL